MKYYVASVVAFLALGNLSKTPAAEMDDQVKAVLEKAIKAHGGMDNLKKYKAGRTEAKGKMKLLGMDLEFSGVMSYMLPAKFRMQMTMEVVGQKMTVDQIADGKKVLTKLNGEEQAIGEAEQKELTDAALLQEINTLVPLMNTEKYTLKMEKKATVNKEEAFVVAVKPKDSKEVRLFFSAKTYLLIKTSRMGIAPGGDGSEILEESYLSDFKEVNGIKVPMKVKVTHKGEDFMELSVTKAEMFESLPAKEFSADK